eukprot:6727991-Alexandrium_andersonii.AAC.1
MSASLVGSEMCIRDSDNVDHDYKEGASGRPCCRRDGQHALAVFAGPVSYTHLTLPTICSV